MIKYILLLFAFNVSASEYQLNVGQSEFEHAWRGPQNIANFKFYADTVGLSYVHDSSIGVSVAYSRAKNHGVTSGKYSDLNLLMTNIVSLELFYRFKIGDLYISPGLSTNYIDASVKSKTTNYYSHDRDDDEGYFLSLDYSFSESFLFRYKFSSHSRIKKAPYDEWTRSHGLMIVYRF